MRRKYEAEESKPLKVDVKRLTHSCAPLVKPATTSASVNFCQPSELLKSLPAPTLVGYIFN